MASKHTKKPWKAENIFGYPRFDNLPRIMTPEKIIATLAGGEVTEVEANALIMAASPDMLDALKGIRDGLQAYLDTMLDMGLYVHVKLFQEKMTGLPAVVEAITKAEKGEQ